MDILNNFSTREKNLWSELVVDIVVALYYFPRMIQMILGGSDSLTGSAMAGLVTNSIILAIITAIVVSVFVHTQKKPEQVDERDHLFKARGNTVGYTVLVLCVVLIMGQAISVEIFPSIARYGIPFEFTGMVIAHLLLMSLYFSSLSKTLVQLFSYRRGY